jgi:hypothetical protein
VGDELVPSITHLPAELQLPIQQQPCVVSHQSPVLNSSIDTISHSIDKLCSQESNFAEHSQPNQLATNPKFQDLRSTLRSECQAQDTVSPALLSSIARTNVPVTVRASQVSLRFLKLGACKIRQLQGFYVHTSFELESARFSALSAAANNAWLTSSINAQYDQQHHALLDRVEQSLCLVEQREAERPTKSTPPTSPKIGSIAIRIMTAWYERNSEHPYPSYEACEVMAKAGKITVEQVKKWFSNRRQRLGNTKLLCQIAARRKRTRTMSQDDILLEGTKMFRLQ